MQMEEKYGCLRMVLLWLSSSLGGEPLLMTPHNICSGLLSSTARLSKWTMSSRHCAEQYGYCDAAVGWLSYQCKKEVATCAEVTLP